MSSSVDGVAALAAAAARRLPNGPRRKTLSPPASRLPREKTFVVASATVVVGPLGMTEGVVVVAVGINDGIPVGIPLALGIPLGI